MNGRSIYILRSRSQWGSQSPITSKYLHIVQCAFILWQLQCDCCRDGTKSPEEWETCDCWVFVAKLVWGSSLCHPHRIWIIVTICVHHNFYDKIFVAGNRNTHTGIWRNGQTFLFVWNEMQKNCDSFCRSVVWRFVDSQFVGPFPFIWIHLIAFSILQFHFVMKIPIDWLQIAEISDRFDAIDKIAGKPFDFLCDVICGAPQENNCCLRKCVRNVRYVSWALLVAHSVIITTKMTYNTENWSRRWAFIATI